MIMRPRRRKKKMKKTSGKKNKALFDIPVS